MKTLLAACGEALVAIPAPGSGVDRSEIREILALRPRQRVVQLTQEAAFLTPDRQGSPGRLKVFDPLAALVTLQRHGVRFVIVGGMAGRLWGSPTMTNAVDICYERGSENLRTAGRCHLADLMRMKRAAGRPKDRVELEVLAAVSEERERLPRTTGDPPIPAG